LTDNNKGAFEKQGFAPLQAAYARRDVLQGQALQCSDGRMGTGAGVDARGALLLHTAHGVEAVLSDEVSVRTSPDTPASDPARG
jgi:BirA family biotin operon repressor/biotin-[acetyl-CoA-carboxylase] ligase